jgi:hypothetical protein
MADLLDSGDRQQFSTGAVRDAAEGKPQLDLISGHYENLYATSLMTGYPSQLLFRWSMFKLEGKPGHLMGLVSQLSKAEGELSAYASMTRLATHLEAGARKYAPFNWAKGMPISRTMASLERHLWQYIERDKTEDHYAAILCNVMFLIHTREEIAEGGLPEVLDDYPFFRSEV